MRQPSWLMPTIAIVSVLSAVGVSYVVAINTGIAAELATGMPDPVGESANLAARLTHLHHSALEDDEMRSHLPAEIQMAMGAERFMYVYNDCFDGPCSDILKFRGGWDHESYLRSKGLDRSHYCLRAYEAFAEEIEWVPRGAFWQEFRHACNTMHSSDVLEDFARLPENIRQECKTKISEGWTIRVNRSHEMLSAPGVLGGSGIRDEHNMGFESCQPPVTRIPHNVFWNVYAFSNGLYGTPEDAPGATDAGSTKMVLAAEMASLYTMALDDYWVRLLLPTDIQASVLASGSA